MACPARDMVYGRGTPRWACLIARWLRLREDYYSRSSCAPGIYEKVHPLPSSDALGHREAWEQCRLTRASCCPLQLHLHGSRSALPKKMMDRQNRGLTEGCKTCVRGTTMLLVLDLRLTRSIHINQHDYARHFATVLCHDRILSEALTHRFQTPLVDHRHELVAANQLELADARKDGLGPLLRLVFHTSTDSIRFATVSYINLIPPLMSGTAVDGRSYQTCGLSGGDLRVAVGDNWTKPDTLVIEHKQHEAGRISDDFGRRFEPCCYRATRSPSLFATCFAFS